MHPRVRGGFEGLASACAVVLLCSVVRHPPRIPAPGLVLWAWERPEDLRFIDPKTTGVAYLAATAAIRPDGAVRFHFRQQPLATPPGTVRIAVVRVESPARYLFPEASRVADGIAAAGSQPGVSAIQIDFDARGSERPFYRDVLRELRMKTALPIGITVLASWCEGDPWIDPDIVSEAVPMFFRMGRNESKDMPVTAAVCRNSTGVSTDEAWPKRVAGRVYVFHPQPWTKTDYERVVRNRRE
jgi:hypothetical protein